MRVAGARTRFPLACDTFYSIVSPANRRIHFPIGDLSGVLAQLVERLVRNEKVRGSNPLGSTTLFENTFCCQCGLTDSSWFEGLSRQFDKPLFRRFIPLLQPKFGFLPGVGCGGPKFLGNEDGANGAG